jgi:hypothetical protein
MGCPATEPRVAEELRFLSPIKSSLEAVAAAAALHVISLVKEQVPAQVMVDPAQAVALPKLITLQTITPTCSQAMAECLVVAAAQGNTVRPVMEVLLPGAVVLAMNTAQTPNTVMAAMA